LHVSEFNLELCQLVSILIDVILIGGERNMLIEDGFSRSFNPYAYIGRRDPQFWYGECHHAGFHVSTSQAPADERFLFTNRIIAWLGEANY
jgi:hypothetical protein